MSEYPEKFWHLCATYRNENGHRQQVMDFDLSLKQLMDIVTCWRREKPFLIGKHLLERKNVIGMTLVHTVETRSEVTQMSQGEFSPQFAVFQKGKDYGQELLCSEPASVSGSEDGLQIALRLCRRIRYSAKVLANRRKNKAVYGISDEYDVQDFLQSILRAYLEHSVVENPLPKLAGVSSRADLSVEALGLIIEVKYARTAADHARLITEFAADQQSYSAWEPLRHFIYLVYGADALLDPESLQELSGYREINGRLSLHPTTLKHHHFETLC